VLQNCSAYTVFFFFGNRTRALAFLQSSTSYDNRGTKWSKIRVFGMLQQVCTGPQTDGINFHGGVVGRHVCGEMHDARIDTSSETPWGQRKEKYCARKMPILYALSAKGEEEYSLSRFFSLLRMFYTYCMLLQYIGM